MTGCLGKQAGHDRDRQALQTSDGNTVATPENWKPGGPVIVPPPQTTEAADARKGEGFEYTDWYFSKKSL